MTLSKTNERLSNGARLNLVLYGDSISEVGRTEGYFGGAAAAERNWGPVLAGKLRATFPQAEIALHHFSIGGQSTYEGLGRLDDLAAFDPHLVLVAFGANDCCYHEISPGHTWTALTHYISETVLSQLGKSIRRGSYRHHEARALRRAKCEP